MSNFDNLRESIEHADSLTQLSEEKSAQLRNSLYPDDYIDFMCQIGFGNLGDLQIYSAPVKPEFVCPAHGDELKSIMLFGDDFQGYCFGFDTHDGMRVVEIDPKGMVDRSLEETFDSFIRGYFA